MTRLLGGMFGLEEGPRAQRQVPDFLAPPCVLMVNARSAMALIFAQLAPPQIWFPSYLCESMLEAVAAHAPHLRFREVDSQLRDASLDFLRDVNRGAVVVLIEYFGFPCDSDLIDRIHARGAFVVVDAAQSLLTSHADTRADFVIYSPRKFAGTPDGGILQIRCERDFSKIELAPPPEPWWQGSLQATIGRREFDLHGGSRAWFEQFQAAEAGQPVGNFAMSPLSQDILAQRIDYEQISLRRRENYLALLEDLNHLALNPALPPEVTPLGFPIRLAERDHVRQALFAQEIYPPIHWSLPAAVPAEFATSHQLSRELLTLPCDQRYDAADMQRMAQIILQELGR